MGSSLRCHPLMMALCFESMALSRIAVPRRFLPDMVDVGRPLVMV